MTLEKVFGKAITFPHFLRVRVVPNAAKTELRELLSDGETLKIALKATPENGKANDELFAFFKDTFTCSVKLISGKSSRTKLLRLEPL